MRKKRKLGITVVLTALLTLCFTGVMLAASAATASVTVTPSVADWEDVGETKSHQVIEFDKSVGNGGSTYFVSDKEYTGAYAADFSVYTGTGGNGTDFEFGLGALRITKDVHFLYVGSDKSVAYTADGTEIAKHTDGRTIIPIGEILGGFVAECTFNLQLDIQPDGDIDVYATKDGSDCVQAGRIAEIRFSDNANAAFALTNGKISVTPIVNAGDDVEPYSTRLIYSVRVITQHAAQVTDTVETENIFSDEALDGTAFAAPQDFTVFDYTGTEDPVYTVDENKIVTFNAAKMAADSNTVKIAADYAMYGDYTADVVLRDNSGGYGTDMIVRLGEKDPGVASDDAQNDIMLSVDVNTIRVKTEEQRLRTAGESEYASEVSLGLEDWWAWSNITLHLRLTVANGNLAISYGYTESGDSLKSLATIEILNNTDGELTDGYLSVSPYATATAVENSATARKLVSVGLAGRYIASSVPQIQDVLFDKNGLKNAGIVGPADAYTTGSFVFDYYGSTELLSKFAFTDDGLSADSDVVFDIAFRSCGVAPQGADGVYGFMFGVPDSAAGKADAGGYIEIDCFRASIYKYGSADKAGQWEPGDFYMDALDVLWKLTAKKDGSLTVCLEALGQTYEQTYTGFDFNGKVAFYAECDSDNGKTVTIRDLAVTGNMTVTVDAVTLDKSVFFGAAKGSIITLTADSEYYVPDVSSPQGVTDTYTFSVTEGAELCTLTENRLTIIGSGYITVRATSGLDSTKYDSYRFFASGEYVTGDYTLDEDFREFNDADWTIVSSGEAGSENAGVRNGALYLNIDFTDTGYADRDSLVSNVAFTTEGLENADDVVFDITFTSAYAGLSVRHPQIGWGLLFGMKSKEAEPYDDGVGYFRINYLTTTAYAGSTNVKYTYLNPALVNENGGVFCEADSPYKIRLVAKRDGTLDVYRAMNMAGYTEEIDVLFATYEGFDFNGYIAFTSDITAKPADNGQGGTLADTYDISIYDVTASGKIRYDGDNVEIRRVAVDESVFLDAIVSDIPLALQGEVYAVPNIASYKEITWSVVSGSAVVDDGNLTVTGAGEITVRATSVTDPSKFDDYTFNALALAVTDITIVNGDTIFSNVTVDTQPIDLRAVVECNSSANKYQAVIWEIVSGPAEVVLNQLRITGVGEVRLKVTAVYDTSVSKEVVFSVSDTDMGIEVPPAGKKGCGSEVGIHGVSACALLVLGCVACMLLRRKRKV